jgi:hypothetical protein
VTGIEDELRAMFAEKAATLPVMDDPTRQTIRRVARLRRRRETLAGLVGVAVMVLTGVGFGVVRGHGAPVTTLVVPAASTYLAPDPAITLDLRVGNQLWTADGRRLALPGAGDVTWVYRVPAGWVYGGTGGMLRMLALDGTEVRSWLAADAATVSQDGDEVASVSGPVGARTLVLGRLSGAGVKLVATTMVSDRAVPVGFVGPSVVLGRADAAGRISAYDFWDPAGNFHPTWNDQIAGVYGATGSRLTGLVSAGPGSTEGCVSYFDLDLRTGLRRAQLGGCGLGLVAGSSTMGSESPGGRWLVDQTKAGVVFVDLASPAPTLAGGYCPVLGRSAPVWEDDSTVLVATDGGLVRCGTDGVDRPIEVSGLPVDGWDVVPAMGR